MEGKSLEEETYVHPKIKTPKRESLRVSQIWRFLPSDECIIKDIQVE